MLAGCATTQMTLGRVCGVLCALLLGGCAGIERSPQRAAPPPTAATQGALGATGQLTNKPAASAPKAPASSHGAAPPKAAASPPLQPQAQVPQSQTPASALAKPGVPPQLDLKLLETRLKETKAIGVFTKLTLKNQIDDLLDRLRAHHQGRIKTSLADLRQSFDLLVLKTVALLQDADPPLASAIVSSRDSLWAILSNPASFATV